MSLRRRIRANFAASGLGQVAGALSQILTVPLLLQAWGKDRYGAWLVLTAIPAWLSVANLGFGNAAGTEMSLRMSRNDYRGANQSLQSGWLGILGISLVGMVLVAPLIVLLPFETWFHLTAIGHREVVWTLIPLALTTFIGFQSPLFGGILWAEGKAATYLVCVGVQPLLNLSVTFVAVRLNGGFMAVSVALLLAQLLFVPVVAAIALGQSERLQLGFSDVSVRDLRLFLRKGSAFCMLPIGNATLFQGSLLVVNACLGANSVVIFGTVRTLTRAAWQLMNMINQTVAPELNRLLGANDCERARRLHRISVMTSLLCGWFLILVILALGPLIYRYWTARQLVVDRPLLGLFCISILTNSLWLTSSTVLLATNKHEGLAWRYLCGSLVNIPLCYVLSKTLGIHGAAISPVVIDCLLIPYVLKRPLSLTHDSLGGFLRSIVKQPIQGILDLPQLLRARPPTIL